MATCTPSSVIDLISWAYWPMTSESRPKFLSPIKDSPESLRRMRLYLGSMEIICGAIYNYWSSNVRFSPNLYDAGCRIRTTQICKNLQLIVIQTHLFLWARDIT